jgi:hypothetical protein
MHHTRCFISSQCWQLSGMQLVIQGQGFELRNPWEAEEG